MIEDYPCYDDRLKARVVDAIECTPASAAKISFLKQVILTETNADAVASASIHFLDAMKIPEKTEEEKKEYSRLFDELRSDDVNVKLRVIAKLEKR